MIKIKNTRFLVTGGAGFIGSHTVDALIAAGGQVAVIDNLCTGSKKNLNPAATFYHCNIASQRVAKIFDEFKPDVVYHFAFNVLVPKSVADPMIDADSIIGSLNILNQSRLHRVKKVIFASSGFIYGNNPRLPFNEATPFQPVSPYAIAKMTVENYLRFFFSAYSLPYVIFRYATVYGPRQTMGAVADYIRQLATGGQADIWGDGSKTRDYVYIDDIVKANLLALKVPSATVDPIFNVSSGKETTLNEVYQLIAKILEKPATPHYHPDRPGEQIRFALANRKIKQELNWQPTYTLSQGLKKRIAYDHHL